MSFDSAAVAQKTMEEILTICEKIAKAQSCEMTPGIAMEMKTAFIANLQAKKDVLAGEVANLVLMEEWTPVVPEKLSFSLDLVMNTGTAFLDNRTWKALQSYPGTNFRYLPIFFQHFLGGKEYVAGKNEQCDLWLTWANDEVAEYCQMLRKLPTKRRQHWYKLIKAIN